MSEKIIGYLLLGLGLLTIIFSAFNVYQVFTKQASPIGLFQLKGLSLDVAQYLPSDPRSATPPPAEIFPAADLNFISNLTAHYLLMSFFIGVGFKVASLGIQLLRPIQVKLSEATSRKSEVANR